MLDDDIRTTQEIEHDICRTYELEVYERASLNEIGRMLDFGLYYEEDVVLEHIDFIERLQSKLQQIRTDEIREGYSVMTLDESLLEVEKLFRKLTHTLHIIRHNNNDLF